MNTLLNNEKIIRKSFSSDDDEVHLTCILFLLHFEAMDSVENTSHCRAINYLYKSKNIKRTKQGIADEMFSNVKTLKQDRILYVAYFLYYLGFIKDKNLTAEWAISSLH